LAPLARHLYSWWAFCSWLALTLIFEILFGRFVVGASWERQATDYNVMKGGLLPFGMLILLMSTLIWRHYRWVAVAQGPYFVWVSLATVLQLSITAMNW
jgi:tryptophan-rich sensory protein